jgi:hypothetical protein
VPWCETCSRYLSPTAMTEEGACPTCGKVLSQADFEKTKSKTPWHFKLLIVVLAVYLGFRLVQLFLWIF